MQTSLHRFSPNLTTLHSASAEKGALIKWLHELQVWKHFLFLLHYREKLWVSRSTVRMTHLCLWHLNLREPLNFKPGGCLSCMFKWINKDCTLTLVSCCYINSWPMTRKDKDVTLNTGQPVKAWVVNSTCLLSWLKRTVRTVIWLCFRDFRTGIWRHSWVKWWNN